MRDVYYQVRERVKWGFMGGRSFGMNRTWDVHYEQFFLIVGGLYSVIALRINDNEGHGVY